MKKVYQNRLVDCVSNNVTLDAFHYAESSQDDYMTITDEIFRLRAQKQQYKSENALQDETLSRIRELRDFIAAQPTKPTEFDETLAKRLIQKITVYEDKFTVEFKSGVSVNIKE